VTSSVAADHASVIELGPPVAEVAPANVGGTASTPVTTTLASLGGSDATHARIVAI
jgi:hypothetical protein